MNLDARLPAYLAALAAGVSKQTFNYWRTNGKVVADENGRYRLGDVLHVEAQVRHSPQSHRGRRRDWTAVNDNSSGMPTAC